MSLIAMLKPNKANTNIIIITTQSPSANGGKKSPPARQIAAIIPQPSENTFQSILLFSKTVFLRMQLYRLTVFEAMPFTHYRREQTIVPFARKIR